MQIGVSMAPHGGTRTQQNYAEAAHVVALRLGEGHRSYTNRHVYTAYMAAQEQGVCVNN